MAETSKASAPSALVVDDEAQMLAIVEFALETQGFTCKTASSAEAAWVLLQRQSFDLVILDVMLPGSSGVALCERIRSTSDISVILLTAKSQEKDRIAGLQAGADDYVTKPFSPRELALRAQAIVRRTKPKAPSAAEIVNGPLELFSDGAYLAGRRLQLTDIEFRLLLVLASNMGAVVGVQQLLNEVWYTFETPSGRDVVKTSVYRLRQRLGEHGDKLVVAVRGVGYTMPMLDAD